MSGAKHKAELLPDSIDKETKNQIKDLFKKGLQSYTYADFELSEEIFREILKINPNMPEAYTNLGNALYKLDRADEAITVWKKSLSIDSMQVICYLNIGNAHYTAGNVNEALTHWHIASTIAPDHPSVILNIGSAYEKKADLITAYKYYEIYLKLAQKSAGSEFKKVQNKISYLKDVGFKNLKVGISFQKKNKLREAAMAYLKAIEAYPNLPKAHLNMGSICYLAGKYKNAVEYWITALKLDSEYEKTYCNLAVAYEKINDYSSAYCMYQRFQNITNNESSEYFNIKKRMEELKKHLDEHPEKSRIHLNRAEEAYKQKNLAEALWEYENFCILKPSENMTYEARIKELSEFVNPVKKAAKTAIEIADKCYENKQYDNALSAYQRYIQLCPHEKDTKEVREKILRCAKIVGKVVNAYTKAL